MSPYIQFQESLVSWLITVNRDSPEKLALIVGICETTEADTMDIARLLNEFGFKFEEPDWLKHHKLNKIILEQIEWTDDGIKIKNLLGLPLARERSTESYALWERERHTYRLRTPYYAHVGVLQPGDKLITGETVLKAPREGGNGSVLLYIGEKLRDGKERAVWLEYPGRAVLSLEADRPFPVV